MGTSRDFGSGFNSGFGSMERALDSNDKERNSDTMNRARELLMGTQNKALQQKILEMPAHLALEQQNTVLRGTMAHLKEMQEMLQSRHLDMMEKMQQSGGGILSGRYMTALMKTQAAMKQIAQKYNAYNSDGTVDESKIKGQDLQDYRDLALDKVKQNTDPKTREKLNNANNVQTTIDKIDPSVLAYYSGQSGKVKLAGDAIKKKLGQSTPQLDAYLNTIQSLVPAVADQLTSYWKTSITSEKSKEIKGELAPKAWINDPQSTYDTFNTFKDVFEAERANTLASLTNPDTYSKGYFPGKDIGQPVTPENMAIAAQAGTQPIKGKSGKTYTPNDIVAAAKQYGVSPKQVIKILKDNG